MGPLIGAVLAALVGAGLGFTFADRPDSQALSWGLVWTVSIGVVMSAAGGILVRHPSGRGVGAVLLGCGAVTALSLLLGGYGLAALQLGAPGATVTLLASESLWPLFVVPLVTLLPLLYPDGRLPGRRWRLVRPGSV